MAATVTGVLLTGVHASRPSSGVNAGTLYSCTTHSLIYQTSDTGSTWATWANLSGSGMTNPMSAVGDIIQGTTAGAPADLAAPLAGKVLTGAGVTTPLVYAYPPGYQLAYAEFTSPVTVTANSEATATSLVSAGAVSFDGSTRVKIEVYAPWANDGGASDFLEIVLYDGSSSIGRMWGIELLAANLFFPVTASRFLTPSNASHTYSARAYRNAASGTVSVGAGGAGNLMPGYIQITVA